jgi:hypothetical protein
MSFDDFYKTFYCDNVIYMRKNILFIVFGITVFCALIVIGHIILGGKPFEKIWDESSLFSLLDKQTADAKSSHDLTKCETLPVKARYRSVGPSGIIYDDNYYIYPKGRCLVDYAMSTLDIAGCQRLENVENNFIGPYSCLSYIAEARTDVSICALEPNNLQANCIALVTLDTSNCFDTPRDEYDTSKYPRSVGWCVVEVVRRTNNYSSCLQINGPDFGEQWTVMRNECLVNVARTKDREKICQLMADDTKGFDQKQRCLTDQIGGDGRHDIPARINK